MFTGIVEEVGSIVSLNTSGLTVAAVKALNGMQLGGSIAVNGACLTVTAFDSKTFSVNVMPETFKLTGLGLLKPGDKVNLERPMVLGGELGGHLVQGHVDGTGRVASVVKEGGAVLIKCETSPELMRYVVLKGFIAVDGTSLTVTDKDKDTFGVSIVGFTKEHTILADRKVNDVVNLEVDIIGKYVAELAKAPDTGITAEFLREHGFMVN